MKVCRVVAFIAALHLAGSRLATAEDPPDQALARVPSLLDREMFREARVAADSLLAESVPATRADSLRRAQVLDLRGAADIGDVGRVDSTGVARWFESLRLHQVLDGQESEPVANTYARLGDLMRINHPQLGIHAAADTLRHGLGRAERAFGDSSLPVARVSRGLGLLLGRDNQLDASREAFRRAIAIQERRLGPEALEIGVTLTAMSSILDDYGNVVQAKENHSRALAIRRRHLPADAWPIGQSLGNLGNQYLGLGDYTTARRLMEEALPIILKHPGPDSVRYTILLNNLAAVAHREGDFAAERAIAERNVSRSAGGAPDPHSFFLSTLARSLLRMGDQEGALRTIDQSIRLLEQHGPGSLNMCAFLEIRASILQDMGRTEDALATLQRARSLNTSRVRQARTLLALILSSIGALETEQGRPDSALAMLEQALAIHVGISGPLQADVGGILTRLARAHRAAGNLDSALATATRGLAVRRYALGEQHPELVESDVELAMVLAQAGRQGEALQQALVAERRRLDHLRLVLTALPERLALDLATKYGEGFDLAMSIAIEGAADSAALDSLADVVVRRRAIVLDDMGGRHAVATIMGDTLGARLLRAFSAARTRYANLVVREGGVVPRDRQLGLMQSARLEAEEAEQTLAAHSVRFRERQARRGVGLEEIRKALPPRSALIAFVEFGAQARDSMVLGRWRPTRSLAAVVVRPEAAHTSLHRVAPLAAVGAAIEAWRREMTRDDGSTAAESRARAAGLAVRRLVVDPLRPWLEGCDRWIVVPDGPLHGLNLAALPDDQGGYLVESAPLLQVLSAERDLARESPLTGVGLLAMGDVDFEGDTDRHVGASSAYRGPAPVCEGFGALHFDRLPGTATEIQQINTMWKSARPGSGIARAQALRGSRADEASFKAMASGNRIIHLATHGFFLGQDCREGNLPTNPLLRAGLALAGANRRQLARLDGEDGVLTAQEVAALDLVGTEWVVLSACNSGLGNVVSGEGVLGLQRAFRIAGAETVIMSLWRVDDHATRWWMEALYRARLEHSLDAARGVREACRDLLRRQRARGLTTHPATWGAFVAVGR